LYGQELNRLVGAYKATLDALNEARTPKELRQVCVMFESLGTAGRSLVAPTLLVTVHECFLAGLEGFDQAKGILITAIESPVSERPLLVEQVRAQIIHGINKFAKAVRTWYAMDPNDSPGET
jgi:hypothetical protein